MINITFKYYITLKLFHIIFLTIICNGFVIYQLPMINIFQYTDKIYFSVTNAQKTKKQNVRIKNVELITEVTLFPGIFNKSYFP